MLFITYWELNENMSEIERLEAAKKLAQTFPPEGVKLIRWDVTPDAWGITIYEADNTIDVFKHTAIWRTKAGMFKTVKTSPAMPVQELMPQMGEYLKSLGK